MASKKILIITVEGEDVNVHAEYSSTRRKKILYQISRVGTWLLPRHQKPAILAASLIKKLPPDRIYGDLYASDLQWRGGDIVHAIFTIENTNVKVICTDYACFRTWEIGKWDLRNQQQEFTCLDSCIISLSQIWYGGNEKTPLTR
jgi:hypothetical protein